MTPRALSSILALLVCAHTCLAQQKPDRREDIITLTAILQLNEQLSEGKDLESRKRTGRRMIELGNELLVGRMAKARAAEIDIAAGKPTGEQRAYLVYWQTRGLAAVAADDAAAGMEAAWVLKKINADADDGALAVLASLKAKGWLVTSFVNSLGMKFVPVPGTKVLFCVHETRVRDFAAFVDANGTYNYGAGETPMVLKSGDYWKVTGASWKDPGFTQTDDHPVTCVSWEDANAFANWLTQKEGKTYRLPSDHEWSLAVGIGSKENENATPESKSKASNTEGIYPWGGDFPPSSVVANLLGEEVKIGELKKGSKVIRGYRDGFARTAPVMSFAPNDLGIYDLSGNVEEWCQDTYLDSFLSLRNKEARVIRGGTWRDADPVCLRSSYRSDSFRTFRWDFVGFRVVLVVTGD